MKIKSIARTAFPLSVVAALVAATSPAALAQQEEDCTRLQSMIEEVEGELREEFSDARSVADSGNAEECNAYVARIESTGGLTAEQAQDAAANDSTQGGSAETTETVQVESEATIEGEVEVTLPDPQVQVEQDPADISVRTPPPEVSVSQGQPKITVRQAQPIIRVTMAQPTISVEQPAPEITITMPEPGVDVATAQPEVEVNIPEPRVTVTQGEPQLAVNLDAEVDDDTASGSNTTIERSDEEGVMTVRADGLSGEAAEPNINFTESEDGPRVSYEGAEPEVEYVSAEPDVQVESDGEPNIELVQSGEPKIMIRQPGEDEGQQGQQQAALNAEGGGGAENEGQNASAESGKRDPSEAFAAADVEGIEGASNSVVKVEELDGMNVVNARDEELGEVGRIVRNGNETYMIVEHGGWFLGLNAKEIALPIADVTLREDNVVLRGLTEEQIASMPEYDYAEEVPLEADDEVTVQRVN